MAEKIRKREVKAYFKMLLVCSFLLLGIVELFLSSDVWAEEIKLPIRTIQENQWQGISASKDYPADLYQLITNKACFKNEWERLRVDSPLPEIDFTKNTLVEIVKINSSREITLKKTLYTERGIGNNKIIVINYYIESDAALGNLAYLFLVTPNSDMPILIQEQRYYDGTFIAKDYVYSPLECACNPTERTPVEAPSNTYFFDDFRDGNFNDNPRWYYKDNNGKIVTGIEGDTHNSSLKWDVLNGYLWFSEGDFTGLDLASDEINVPIGLNKLVIEFDTFFGGTWANHNLITLEDAKGNVVFGGGIYCDGYAYRKGNHKTNNGLLIIGAAESFKKELPDNSLNPSTWKHVKIIFDHGNITIDCDNGEFIFAQAVKFRKLPEIRRVRIGGWQHSMGSRFDNIRVWNANLS